METDYIDIPNFIPNTQNIKLRDKVRILSNKRYTFDRIGVVKNINKFAAQVEILSRNCYSLNWYAFNEIAKVSENSVEKELNLYEILKGHEGETFYSETLGNVVLHSINKVALTIRSYKHHSIGFTCNISDAGKDLFPSKDQRDWIKWDKENNHKTPKIWSEIINDYWTIYAYEENAKTPIEKSALALLKIHQLIEVGYGGNVNLGYSINADDEGFNVYNTLNNYRPFAFHTKKQAEEFLSYPENIQLLKDYFMIP